MEGLSAEWGWECGGVLVISRAQEGRSTRVEAAIENNGQGEVIQSAEVETTWLCDGLGNSIGRFDYPTANADTWLRLRRPCIAI